jgi:hypothetical protein
MSPNGPPIPPPSDGEDVLPDEMHLLKRKWTVGQLVPNRSVPFDRDVVDSMPKRDRAVED